MLSAANNDESDEYLKIKYSESHVEINKPWVVKNENLLSKSKNTSIENKKLQGKVTNTFVNGEELYKL